MKTFENDIVIIGGMGHVGLPLGIAFANQGQNVCLFDLNEAFAKDVMAGKMPFIEYGAEPVLKDVLQKKKLSFSSDPACVGKAKHIVIAIGTPVDEYLNPKTRQFVERILELKPHISDEQIFIIRSTVYPQTAQQMRKALGPGDWKIAYCPERIVQGYAIQELKDLPQIVAGLHQAAEDAAVQLFEKISPKIIRVKMGEAESVKLFSNAWRYTQFAVANQFYMICQRMGVSFDRVRKAMMDGYGRNASLPRAGFAAGPCLLKDTMQLASFDSQQFLLGHAAMMVNEGLPNFMVEMLKKHYDLNQRKIGILGMAFKAEVDDIRDSLSYKLGKILRFHGAEVLYSDEFAQDPTFSKKEEVLKQAEIVIVAVPHKAYEGLQIPDSTEVVDLWNVVKGGKRQCLQP